MIQTAQQAVDHLLPKQPWHVAQQGVAFAPVNIALIKYWGKRDIALNLPITDSLSVGLSGLGTHTCIELQQGVDQITLNGECLSETHPFSQRTSRFLDLFRPEPDIGFVLNTRNDVPTGAGLASSASGYAALVLALDDLFGWQCSRTTLSILARIGSGSASRSLWDGFVHWHAGVREDGMDSFAEPMSERMPTLRVGLLTLCAQAKPVSSRSGMQQTVNGLSLYAAWPHMVQTHLTQLIPVLGRADVEALGVIAEHNALAMHASMLSAYPSLCYWLPETLATLQHLWTARNQGLACWATLDAGPNVKLLFDARDEDAVREHFPKVQVVVPFAD